MGREVSYVPLQWKEVETGWMVIIMIIMIMNNFQKTSEQKKNWRTKVIVVTFISSIVRIMEAGIFLFV